MRKNLELVHFHDFRVVDSTIKKERLRRLGRVHRMKEHKSPRLRGENRKRGRRSKLR